MHKLTFKQTLPVSIKEAWDFFSSPLNLKSITPPYMGFDVTSEHDDKMYEGMIITYIVKPIFNIPIEWVSEITHINDYDYFIDEQRSGPYKIWHHLHKFSEVNGEVEMTDEIYYKLGYGIIGRILNKLIVRKKLMEIFNYRRKVLTDIFKN